MTKKTSNAADAQAVKRQEQDAKNQRETELAAVRAMITTKGGRLWLWNKLAKAHVFTSSFTGNSTTFFNEGMRALGLDLLNDVMEADPAGFVAMMREFGDYDDGRDHDRAS